MGEGEPCGCAKFGTKPTSGLVENFIYLFIFTLFHELTYRSDPSRIFTPFGSSDADSRRDVPF